MHAPSIQAWLNLLQRASYPHNTRRIWPSFARGAEISPAAKSLDFKSKILICVIVVSPALRNRPFTEKCPWVHGGQKDWRKENGGKENGGTLIITN
jgi:hypothetical protein